MIYASPDATNLPPDSAATPSSSAALGREPSPKALGTPETENDAPDRWEARAKFSHDGGDVFFRTVRSRVSGYLAEHGKNRFDDGTIALKGLLFGGLAATFYAGMGNG